MFSGAKRGNRLSRLVKVSFVPGPLAGCAGITGMGSAVEAATAPSAPTLDPNAAFVADPPSQAQAQVFLPESNETATLRTGRQYAAGSERKWREVRVVQRSGDKLRLFCRAGTGWFEARPLIAQTVGR
jgi:hypothetical protein